MLPCSECLVSLVDHPPTVFSVSDIEHVHFERVTFTNKDCDMVVIFKEGAREKGTDEYVRIGSVPRKSLDNIKGWLDEVADLTFTESVANLEWKSLIADFVRQSNFWDNVDDDGEDKPSGWDFLRDTPDAEDEDGSEDESAYEETTEDSSDDESEFDVDSEDDSDDDDLGSDDVVSEGDDWDELEEKAEKDDRKRSREEYEEDTRRRAKVEKGKKKPRRD